VDAVVRTSEDRRLHAATYTVLEVIKGQVILGTHIRGNFRRGNFMRGNFIRGTHK
jgi:hypothetical protein